MRKTINVGGITSTEKIITLVDGKLKYGVWVNKKDGTPTKAYEQLKQLGVTVGMNVEAEVDEEPKTFVNGKGQTINFTSRTVRFFYTSQAISGNSGIGSDKPLSTPPEKGQSPQPTTLESVVNKLAERVAVLEKRVNEINPPEEDHNWDYENDKPL